MQTADEQDYVRLPFAVINTTKIAANLINSEITLDGYLGKAHAVVQANISILLTPVNTSRHTEKIAVKPATIPNRTAMLRIWYNNTIEQIGNKEYIRVPMISVH